MATHKLIPYWIELREYQEPDRKWDQRRIPDPDFPYSNLADYVEDFLNEYAGESNAHMDEKAEKTFIVEPPIKRDGNTIEGRIKSGEWGQNADFFDIDKHERIEDARQENHAQEYPYYFLFHIPDVDSSRALLVLSRYKRKGIKGLFKRLLLPRKRGMDTGNAYMEIEPHYTDKIVEQLTEADSIASIRFRGEDVMPAREEYAAQQRVGRTGTEMSAGIDIGTELKVTPKGEQDSFLEFALGLVRDKDDPRNFEYGKLETNKYDTASVTVVEGESQLTFSLWKEEIQMRLDLDPDDHDLDIYGGFPTPYSQGCVARQLANDLMREVNTPISTESLMPRSVGMPDDEPNEPVPAED